MQHTRQSRLTLLSGLAFSMPAMLAGVANASDAAITLDRVERSVQVVTDFTTKSDSNNELTNEEWHGHLSGYSTHTSLCIIGSGAVAEQVLSEVGKSVPVA